MSKKIDWLDNFAADFGQRLSKTASKKNRDTVIVDRKVVAGSKLGDTIHFDGKLYKVADLDFEDEKGPGAVLEESDEAVDNGVEQTPEGPISTSDPMSVSMGAPAANYEGGQTSQEYARTNPGDVYHYEVRDETELSAYQQSAAETAQQIERDRSIDRSSVQNHYLNPSAAPGAGLNTGVEEVNAPGLGTPAPMDANEPSVEPSVEPSAEPSTEEVPVENEMDAVPTENAEVPVEEENTDPAEGEEAPKAEESEEDKEEKEDEMAVESFRHNRILRRIMASNRGGK